MNTYFRLTFLAALLAASLPANADLFGPDNYYECVFENLNKAYGSAGVHALRTSCGEFTKDAKPGFFDRTTRSECILEHSKDAKSKSAEALLTQACNRYYRSRRSQKRPTKESVRFKKTDDLLNYSKDDILVLVANSQAHFSLFEIEGTQVNQVSTNGQGFLLVDDRHVLALDVPEYIRITDSFIMVFRDQGTLVLTTDRISENAGKCFLYDDEVGLKIGIEECLK